MRTSPAPHRLVPKAPAVALLALLATLLPATGGAQSDDETARALLAAGGQALATGDLDAAAGAFRTVTESRPQLALGWLGLAEVEERRDNLSAALEHARRAEAIEPAAPVALVLGRLLGRLGATDEALEQLERVRAAEPRHPAGYAVGALLLRDRGRRDEAIALLEQGREAGAADLEPDLAELYLSTGKAERAHELASLVLQRDDVAERGSWLLLDGLALAAGGEEPELAIERLRGALEAGVPDPYLAHLELGRLELERGAAAAAVAELEAARALNPVDSEVHYRLGAALRAAGDAEGARAALERFRELSQASDAAETEAKEIGIALNRAQTLAADSRLAEALAALDELLAGYPGEHRALALKAKVLFSMGRYDDALAAIRGARELAAASVEYGLLEGLFRLQVGDLDGAEEPLRDVIALAPELGEAYELLALANAGRKRYEAAAELFEQALERGADGTRLRLNYANVLENLGRTEESARQMEAYERLKSG